MEKEELPEKKQDRTDSHNESRDRVARMIRWVKRLMRQRGSDDADWKLESSGDGWSEDLLPTWQAGSNAALKFDRKENAETTPPDDEHIALRCVWAVEFYPPSYSNKLLDSFQKLGWNKGDDPCAWVNNARRYFDGSGSFDLGTIDTAEKPGTSLAGGRTAPLPPGVDYAVGHLYRLTPSLMCIVMCFVFNAPFQDKFDQVLRTDRKTSQKRCPPMVFQLPAPRKLRKSVGFVMKV